MSAQIHPNSWHPSSSVTGYKVHTLEKKNELDSSSPQMASSFCQCQNLKSGGRTVSSLAFFCIQADTTPRQLYLVIALKCEMKCISFIFLFCILCYFLGTGSHQFWSEVLHMLTLILHPFIVCSLHCSWDSLLKCKSGHVTSCWRILPWPPHDFWNNSSLEHHLHGLSWAGPWHHRLTFMSQNPTVPSISALPSTLRFPAHSWFSNHLCLHLLVSLLECLKPDRNAKNRLIYNGSQTNDP